MLYSDSSHFSDKISYKILFISSCGLKDIKYARYKHLQEFFRKQNEKQQKKQKKKKKPLVPVGGKNRYQRLIARIYFP
jgi:hypothetical protein